MLDLENERRKLVREIIEVIGSVEEYDGIDGVHHVEIYTGNGPEYFEGRLEDTTDEILNIIQEKGWRLIKYNEVKEDQNEK